MKVRILQERSGYDWTWKVGDIVDIERRPEYWVSIGVAEFLAEGEEVPADPAPAPAEPVVEVPVEPTPEPVVETPAEPAPAEPVVEPTPEPTPEPVVEAPVEPAPAEGN